MGCGDHSPQELLHTLTVKGVPNFNLFIPFPPCSLSDFIVTSPPHPPLLVAKATLDLAGQTMWVTKSKQVISMKTLKNLSFTTTRHSGLVVFDEVRIWSQTSWGKARQDVPEASPELRREKSVEDRVYARVAVGQHMTANLEIRSHS